MRFLSIRKPRSGRSPRRGLRRFGALGNVLATVLIFGACALLAVRLDGLGMRNLTGAVVVHDGDTLTVSGERIRLSGIDAFELDQTCLRNGVAYPCGEEARARLSRLVGEGDIRCEGKRRDRYRRLLAVCFAGETELNKELVSAGLAVSYGGYQIEEMMARFNGRGAWDGDFVAPSDWRADKGLPAEPRHDIVSRMVSAIGQYLF